MEGRAERVILAVAAMLCLPSANPLWGAKSAAGRTFALAEIPVTACPESVRGRLEPGQSLSECGTRPRAGVTYPAFKSSEPVYGVVPFRVSAFDQLAGIRYEFALDKSADTGYDRLYFDANGDSDLTNDPAVSLVVNGIDQMDSTPGYARFGNIQVTLNYGPGQGTFTQAVVPRMMATGDGVQMYFGAPTVRTGKIMLGTEEVELVLGQTYISGRYDGAMTDAFLVDRDEPIPAVGYWHHRDGTFYRLRPTPAGDKVTVAPYTGPYGFLVTDKGDAASTQPTIELGWLMSKDAIIDIRHCRQSDGTLKVPAGEYRPLRMAVRYGQRLIGVAVDTSQLGQEDAEPPVFPIVIRPDETHTLDFSEKLEVVFANPTAGSRVRSGDTVTVQATLRNVRTGIMISGIEDTTRKTGSTEAFGQELDIYESVSPTVVIASASGRVVADGDMPFG